LPGKVDLSRKRPVRMGATPWHSPGKKRRIRMGRDARKRRGKEFALPPNREN